MVTARPRVCSGAFASHLDKVSSVLGEGSVFALRSAADNVRVAREALAALRKAALTPELLSGTGADEWKAMWEAVGEFSEVAYPGAHFPVVTEEALCPFCQQKIGADGAARLKHFAEYVSSDAQAAVTTSEKRLRDILAEISHLVVERADVTVAVVEVSADDANLGQRIAAENCAILCYRVGLLEFSGLLRHCKDGNLQIINSRLRFDSGPWPPCFLTLSTARPHLLSIRPRFRCPQRSKSAALTLGNRYAILHILRVDIERNPAAHALAEVLQRRTREQWLVVIAAIRRCTAAI